MVCVILHNMIIEYEQSDDAFDHRYDFVGRVLHPCRKEGHIKHFIQVHHEIRDAKTHQQLYSLSYCYTQFLAIQNSNAIFLNGDGCKAPGKHLLIFPSLNILHGGPREKEKFTTRPYKCAKKTL
jgi:hypothetical protein